MFRNLMVPWDGSAFSEQALPLAVGMAEVSSAKLHIVRVHVPAAPTAEVIVTANYDELLRQYEREGLQDLARHVEDAGVAVTVDLLDGPVASALDAYAEASEIDLVVLTTHGRSGLKRVLLGSVAEAFARLTDVPVLLVPPRATPQKTTSKSKRGQVMVTLDGSEEAEAVLPHAVAMAEQLAAELVLVRMVAASFEIAASVGQPALGDYSTRLREQSETYLHKIATTTRDRIPTRILVSTPDTVTHGILDLIRIEQPDVLAMATHGRRGLDRIALGSIAESVLRNSPVPVLLVRASTPVARNVGAPPHAAHSQ